MKKLLAITLTLFLTLENVLIWAYPPPIQTAPERVARPDASAPSRAPASDGPASVQESRARQALTAALVEQVDVSGPDAQVALGEVRVEGHWAYGVVEGQGEAETPDEPQYVLAHLLPDGSWEAVVPGGGGVYPQWVDGVPDSLSLTNQTSEEIQTIEFLKQGFSVQVPAGWSSKVGNVFGPHLPHDTITLGMLPTSFDISIVSVVLSDDFPQNIEDFATAIFGTYRGIPTQTDLTFQPSQSNIKNSIRAMNHEPTPDETVLVTSLSEFIVVKNRGYWLSTSFYSLPNTSLPLDLEGEQRVRVFEQVVNSFTTLVTSSVPDVTITLQDLQRVNQISNAIQRSMSPQAVFVWPTTGYIGTIYNYPVSYGDRKHNGVDIWTSNQCNENNTSPGNAVYPVSSGYLDYRYSIPGGVYDGVRIDYGIINGVHVWTHYWHLASLDPNTGVQTSHVKGNIGGVTNQTEVGYQGNLMRNGNEGAVQTTCIHLHITVANGNADSDDIDPSPYFDTGLDWNEPNHIGYLTEYVEHSGSPPQPTDTPPPGSTCDDYWPGDNVILFDSSNCGGSSLPWNAPTDRVDLGSAWNDRTMSIHVSPNWSIMIYEHNDGYGSSLCIDRPMWNLPVDNYSDGTPIVRDGISTISSVQVYNNSSCSGGSTPTDTPQPSGEVKLWSLANYGGSIVWSGGTGFSNGPSADSYSLELPSGWSAKTWRGDDRSGEEHCWPSSVHNLQDHGWHLAIQSIEVFNYDACPPPATSPPPSGEVKLWSAANYGGSVVWSGGTGFSNDPNSDSYALEMPSGWSVKTWRGDNRSGEERCWPSSVPNLQDHGWQLAVQSIEVFSYNACTPSATSTPQPSGDVKLWSLANYGGSVVWSGGTGFSNDPNADSYALEIPGGWSVKTWRGDNRSGEERCWSSSVPNLQDHGWQLTIQSIEVFDHDVCSSSGGGDVVMCTTDDASSGCYSFLSIGVYDLTKTDPNLNDQIRSIHTVPDGMSVMLFREGGLRGTCECYNGSRIPLPEGHPWDLRGQVTDAQVFDAQNCPSSQSVSVIMHNGTNYGGHHWGMGHELGMHNMGSIGGPPSEYFNDQAESISIPSGWSVRLYEHDNGGGNASGCLTGDVPDLGSLKNQVSSVEIFHNTSCTDPIPAAPTDLAASGASEDSVTLSWQDHSNVEDGFRIYRWGYDGTEWNFFYHDAVGANTTTYSDSGLDCETTYFYEVSAYNGTGESAHTVWADGTTGACPPAGPMVYESHGIDDNTSGNSAGNGDGIVNCGETIELYATLRNQGGSAATGVTATISVSDTFVSWLYNTDSTYPDIPGGSTGTNNNDFDFSLSANAPDGHVLHFDLSARANEGGPWTDAFDVVVDCSNPPQVRLYSLENYTGTVVFSRGTGFSNAPDAGSYSLEIPNGWSVKTWRGDDRSGDERCWVSSAPDLQGYGWHDAIQSIEVFDSNVCPEVRLYDDVNYNGVSGYVNNPGRYTLEYGFNDMAESIAMPNGWSVRLFQHNNYSEPHICIAGSDPDLWDDVYGDGSVVANSATTLEVYDQASCPPPAPNAPSDLAVTGATQDSLTLYWQDNADDEEGVKVYRWGFDGTDWTFMYLDAVNANLTSYTDTGLDSGKTYYYQVSAYNGSGESVRTDWIAGTTDAPARLGQPGLSFHYAGTVGITGQAYPADTQHFNGPSGLFVDGSDNLYVVEESGSRVLKFNPSGSALLTLGTAGSRYTDDDVFNLPKEAIVDGSGNLWVLDEHRAVQYDSNGVYQQKIGDWWSSDDNAHFNAPRGLALDSAGRLYISDSQNQRVQVYDLAGGTAVYSTTIGVTGVPRSDNTGFDQPGRIAIDSSDRLYVMDAANYRVQRCVWAGNWTCDTFFGATDEPGAALDRLNWASGIALAPDGSIYIADGGNYRVLKCDSSGACNHFAGTTGERGSDNAHFWWPADVAVNSSGDVFVSDQDNHRVQKFNSGGGYVSTSGVNGAPFAPDTTRLNAPWGIVAAPDGGLYVAERWGYRLLKFNAAGVQEWSAGEAGVYGNDDAHLGDWWAGPEGDLALDASGRVYVPDTGNNRVQIFNPDGSVYDTLGNWGTGDYEFECPASVAISPLNGDIFVLDRCNQRVQVFDRNRTYKTTLGVTDETGSDNVHFDWPWGLATDANGRLYVSDSNNRRVQKCSLSGSSYTCITFAGETGVGGNDFLHFWNPLGIAVDNAGRVYVADEWNSRVQVFDGDGDYLTSLGGWGTRAGQFFSPAGVALDSAGNLYVSDQTLHHVHKFTPGVAGWRQANLNGFGDPRNDRVIALASFAGQLYAGTHNAGGAQLWRQGAGDTWTRMVINGFGNTENVGLIHLAEFNGRLYASTQADESGGEVWRSSNGQNWSRVVAQGFAGPHNGGVFRLAVFNGQLYAGTWSYDTAHGAEVWRSDTGNAGDWEQVVTNGFGDANNGNVISFEVFDGRLYASTWNSATGGELWRTSNGQDWEQSNLDGFGSANNAAVMSLAAFNDYLYAGTSTAHNGSGGELWRCQVCAGGDWQRVVANGFANPDNGSMDALAASDSALYAVAANETTGLEVWYTRDGSQWSPLNTGGLGDSNNIAPWADNSVLVFGGKLYVGTQNGAHGGEVWTAAAQYDVFLPLVLRGD